MSDKNRSEIEIPVEGNLGILAYGDIALEAWREKRGPIKVVKKESEEKKKKKENE